MASPLLEAQMTLLHIAGIVITSTPDDVKGGFPRNTRREKTCCPTLRGSGKPVLTKSTTIMMLMWQMMQRYKELYSWHHRTSEETLLTSTMVIRAEPPLRSWKQDTCELSEHRVCYVTINNVVHFMMS
uniref:Uncharacterized protein n=1 Tax=Ciona savignyi TaxID=51511 RepID=H2Z9V3_CIOSA